MGRVAQTDTIVDSACFGLKFYISAGAWCCWESMSQSVVEGCAVTADYGLVLLCRDMPGSVVVAIGYSEEDQRRRFEGLIHIG